MVLPSLVTGGMEAVVARLARGLSAKGIEVGFTLTVEEGILVPALREEGFPVSLLQQPKRFASLRVAGLAGHFRSRRPDVVHVHSGVWLRAARAAKLASSAPVVHTIHGLLSREPLHGPALKRLAMRFTDEVVAVSPSLREYLHEVVGIRADRISLIANGVDTNVYRPVRRNGDLRAEFGIPNHAMVVGTVARSDAIKNQALIIRALPLLISANFDAHVLLVGDGPERGRLLELADSLNLRSRVHFAGVRAVDARLYAELDIFALPSFLEGTSISLLEAMSCGVTTIASSVGGTKAVLGDCPFPSTFESGDVEAFARLCKHYSFNAQESTALRAWLRRRTEERYSESLMVDQYIQCYSRLLSSPTLARNNA